MQVEICEMKRLYVKPEARGKGVGRALAQAAIHFGQTANYRLMRLDTLPQMAAAQRLYLRLGFREIPAYYCNPIAGTRFMELVLVDNAMSNTLHTIGSEDDQGTGE
jgi:ribosomal protein S18 acetylase RimI-like enzyme